MRVQQTRLVVIVAVVVTAVVMVSAAINRHKSSLDYYRFANIKEGQKLSGDVSVAVQARGSLNFLTLWVDNSEYGGQNVEGKGPERYAGFDIPTFEYANGPHTLEVKVGQQTLDTRHVMFQNDRHPLYATSITHVGISSRVTGTVYPGGPWKAVIQNSDGQILHSWRGDGYSINLLWDGTNRSGKPVADGTYRFVATTEVLGETFSCPIVKKIHPAP